VVGGPSSPSRYKRVGATCTSMTGGREAGGRRIKYSARPERGKGIDDGEGQLNSRQHVQPRKNDLEGQCSPRKQAIVVRRRESIASPLSLSLSLSFIEITSRRDATSIEEAGVTG